MGTVSAACFSYKNLMKTFNPLKVFMRFLYETCFQRYTLKTPQELRLS